MRNKSYLKQSHRHFLLGIVFNILCVLIAYTFLQFLHDAFDMKYRAYVVAVIVTPIATTLILHEPISAFVNYILEDRSK